MVGRKVLLRVEKGPARPREPVLEVARPRGRATTRACRGSRASASTVRAGEIVGIAGVAGNGQSELLDALAGIRHAAARRDPAARARRSTSPAPGARAAAAPTCRRTGCAWAWCKGFTACENAILGYQIEPDYAEHGFLRRSAASSTSAGAGCAATTCARSEPLLEAHSFSGGNQQKLVLAREMEHDPDLLLVGQPTRGVDIGAIEFIHRRLIAMRDAGKAVLLVSVELDEILSLSDRILVMFDGTITGELSAAEADERRIGLLMAGVTKEAA